MPATRNAGRRKVRCPKCTALFSEPNKVTFECPICSCRLSANKVVTSTVNISSHAKEREFGQIKVANGSDGGSRVQNQEGCIRGGSDTQQDTHTDICEEDWTQIHKEEKEPVTENEELYVASDNDGKEEKALMDDTVEDLYGNKDDAAKDSSSIESSLAVVNNEVLEGEDSVGKVGKSNKRLDLEVFRTTRCEFSFKYSLEGAQPVESDTNRKRLPPSKFSLSVPNTEASDVSLYTPLRVKISNRCEESSDQSEHERYSCSSDTNSHDGSESDFDFPAPWADGLKDKALPDSAGQNELVEHHSKPVTSMTPHQLELQDVYDTTGNEEYVLQESSKYPEESGAGLSLSVDVDVNTSRSGKENELLSSQVNDLANIISSVVSLNPKQNLVESLAATTLSNQQVSQFVSSAHNISSVDAHSTSHIRPSRNGIQASNKAGASDNEQMTLTGMGNANRSFVLQGPLADGLLLDLGKGVHSITEPHARVKNTYDNHVLQDAEMEGDLYSHHNVDEWQPEQMDDSPPDASDYTPIMENQSHYPDLQQMERHSSVFSDYALNSIPLANSQPYVVANHCVSDHLSFGASSSNQMYAYQVPQVPLQPLLLPATTFQDHSMVAPVTYHTVSNACMLCSHHQHPYMQNHVGHHCAVCVTRSGSMVWNSGHPDQWSCHQVHHGPGQAFASSLAVCTQGPTNLSHRHDFPSADLRFQAYLSGKLSQYPPLPKHSAAPYFSCKGCSRVLQVPVELPSTNGFIQKLRCSACGKVNKFSAKHHTKQRQVVSGSPFLQMSSMGGTSSKQPLAQYNSLGMISSHDQHALPMSSWQHEESSSKTICQVYANSFTPRVSSLSLQGGDYLGSNPRDHTGDSSNNVGLHDLENTSSVTGLMTAEHKVLGSTHNVRFERRRQDAVSSLHAAVDEKDEGLDFGAPRISDGDSLDHSESRMRSPENIQAQGTFAGDPKRVPLGDSQATGQVLKLDQSEELNPEVQGKKPGSPLLVLLNQESTRFMLNLDPRAPSEQSKSALLSPALDSLPIDNVTQNCHQRKERASSQSRKGPKYIAGLLRRSLKDLNKGGQ